MFSEDNSFTFFLIDPRCAEITINSRYKREAKIWIKIRAGQKGEDSKSGGCKSTVGGVRGSGETGGEAESGGGRERP